MLSFVLIIVLMMLEDIFENEQLALDMFVYRLVILNLRTEPLTTFYGDNNKLIFFICINSNNHRNMDFL